MAFERTRDRAADMLEHARHLANGLAICLRMQGTDAAVGDRRRTAPSVVPGGKSGVTGRGRQARGTSVRAVVDVVEQAAPTAGQSSKTKV